MQGPATAGNGDREGAGFWKEKTVIRHHLCRGVAGARAEPQYFAGSSHQELGSISLPMESGWVFSICFGQSNVTELILCLLPGLGLLRPCAFHLHLLGTLPVMYRSLRYTTDP